MPIRTIALTAGIFGGAIVALLYNKIKK